MKLLEYIFYRFFVLFYPEQPARQSAFWAMLLLSVSVYVYLVNFYALLAWFGLVRFVSLFVNSSYDFSILLVGLIVQLFIYQSLIYENRFVRIHQFFTKNRPSQELKLSFLIYLVLCGISFLSFLLILEYTSRLG